ncbi:MAG: dephospho-CoA kinase [Oscillospiraceae bacterium]|nr:dephospho-CoA kinase [Oscillospiraceae bacterium]MBR2977050.1 dephospho-CoA kinase [Oscillospiraceae bacterium]
MKVIGVTGGTGSGKTTLLRFLQGRGAAVLDCDRVYDELLARDEALQSDLRREFGEAFSPDGALDRAALAETVFSDPARLRRLNAIVYYHMGLEVRRLLVEAKNRGTEMAVIDAINLVDSGLSELCGVTVAVLADEKTRLRRIMQRDGIDEARAQKRIAAQKTEEYFRKHCKIALENNGTEEEFLAAAEAALEEYI